MGRAENTAERLRLVVRALVRRMRAAADDEPLPAAQLSVLRRLETDGPMTCADLARAERVKPQSAGAIVAEVERAGLVSRRADAADGRRRLVSLTRTGRRTLAERRAARQGWLARAIDRRLDANEQRELLAALDLLRRLSED